MADETGPPIDPAALQAQVAGAEQLRELLFQIHSIKSQLTQDDAQLVQMAQQQVQSYEAALKQKLQMAQAEGQILDSEQKRNFIIKEEVAELRNQLNLITTTDATRKRNLESIRAKQRAINTEITAAIQQHGQEHSTVLSLQKRLNSAKDQERALLSSNLQLTEQQRQSLVSRLQSEIEYRRAAVQTSEITKSAHRALLGLSGEWRNTLLGAFGTMTKSAVQSQGAIKGLITSANSLVNSLNNAASVSNIVGSTIMKIQEKTIYMVKEIDRSQVSLRSATGASREFAAGLDRAFNDIAIKQMAASYGELTQLQSTLFGLSKRYSEQTAAERLAIDRLGMAAKRSGISYEDFATVVDKSVRIFGGTAVAAMNKLYNSALAIGEKPAQVVKAYTQSLDVLAQYTGPRAIKVFQELVSWQKSTGVETQKLLNIVSQYNTFESAATSVSRLNTILGGAYFNTIQMLKATESERIQLLHEGFRATNMNWDSLGRYQRQAVATAAGIKDLSVAAAIFRGELGKVNEVQARAARHAQAQQRLIELGMQFVPIGQRMVRVMQEFGVFAQKLVPYIQTIAEILNRMEPSTALLYLGFYKLSTAIAAFTLRAAAARIAVGGMAGGLSSMVMGITGLVPLVALLGVAFVSLQQKVNKKGSPPFWKVFGTMASGIHSFAQGANNAIDAARKLGSTISALPTDRMIKVAQVTRQVGASAAAVSGGASSGRMAAVSAQAAAMAVSVARQNELPAGGGAGRLPPGVLVTDSINVKIPDYQFSRAVGDVVSANMASREQSARLRST